MELTFTFKSRAMKVHMGSGGKILRILKLSLDEGEWSASRSCLFNPNEMAPAIQFLVYFIIKVPRTNTLMQRGAVQLGELLRTAVNSNRTTSVKQNLKIRSEARVFI
jgi:hypothetical protein